MSCLSIFSTISINPKSQGLPTTRDMYLWNRAAVRRILVLISTFTALQRLLIVWSWDKERHSITLILHRVEVFLLLKSNPKYLRWYVMFVCFWNTPELGTNRLAGMGIGARGAKISTGAGADPAGLAVLLGFRTSTYLLLTPENKRTSEW